VEGLMGEEAMGAHHAAPWGRDGVPVIIARMYGLPGGGAEGGD